jgi:hypothetical protein
VKILMTNNALHTRGGSETYLDVTSSELRRLGHEVSFFSPLCGDAATRLRSAGFDVFEAVEDLPRAFDVIHGQHANAVGLVRTRLPRVPLVFATHSWLIAPLEDPVAELGAAAYVAFNELTRRRLVAHVATAGAEVVRLTQPVEVSFAGGARVPIGSVARRAVAVSRRMKVLPERLATACATQGIEFEWVGGPSHDSPDARQEMRAADIVVAMGRTALEAMVMGRAVLVLDDSTIGGWVDDASYAALEADGFTGLETDRGEEGLEALLDQYSPDLGAAARRLALRHHAAQHHAARLLDIYTSVADTRAEAVSAHTVALLANDRFALESRAVAAEWEAARHHDLIKDLRDQLARSQADLEAARVQVDALRDRSERLQERRDRVRRQRDALRKTVKELRAERDEARRSRFRRIWRRRARRPDDGGR